MEAMAGWSVKPGPKRLKLEVAVNQHGKAGRGLTVDVAEGEAVHLRIQAVVAGAAGGTGRGRRSRNGDERQMRPDSYDNKNGSKGQPS